MLNNDMIYTTSYQSETLKIQAQIEYYLLSALSIFEVLDQQHIASLPRTQYYYFKNMYATVQELFFFYGSLYAWQSVAAKNYAASLISTYLFNADSPRDKKQELLYCAVYQLNALCSEGLDVVMLDHLSDRGGNLLINVTTQVQLLQELLESLNLKPVESTIAL